MPQYPEAVYDQSAALVKTRLYDTTAGTYAEYDPAGALIPGTSRALTDVDRGLVATWVANTNADTMRGSLRSVLPQLIANQASAAPTLLNLGWAQQMTARVSLLERAVVALLRRDTDMDDTTAGTT